MTSARSTSREDAGDGVRSNRRRRSERVAAPRSTKGRRSRADSCDPTTDAIDRAVRFLRSRQLRSGAWLASECFEPQSSATHLLTLAFIDRVPHVEARGYARFLATLQREDGSFPPYPHADRGDAATTALVYAALGVANLEEHAAARARALEYVEANGGFEVIRQELVTGGNLTAVYLAMAGLVDPFELPDPELSFILAPPVLDALLKKMHAGVVQTIIFIGAVTRALRERKKPSPQHLRRVHDLEAHRCAEFMEEWLNPNGNNCGVTSLTDMSIAALFALGRSPESPRLYSAVCWFNHHRVWDERGLHLEAFTNENWMTAWSLRALLAAGVDRDDPAVCDGLDYLCWSQSKLPMHEVNLRRKNAHRAGGWGFQEDNLLLVDTDDTGIVLSALGLALDRSGEVVLDAVRRQRVEDSVDLALQNLLDMQNDDGGWSGFVWNLGSKAEGPLFDKPISMPSTLVERIRFLVDAPLELGEPAIEGLTGRVLQGLGANGFGPASPEVQRAARFLEERQTADGSWWARWIIGYLAATASIVSGLAACRWDLGAPWIQRAIQYLLSKQNQDGGWGETPAAYERPHAGIESPSMPPLTAIVVIALVDAGLGDHPSVDRAVSYLAATQREEGCWPSCGWLQIMQPYASYYDFEGEAWYRPLEALAKVRAFRERDRVQRVPARQSADAALLAAPPVAAMARARTSAAKWDAAELRRMRRIADPVADLLVREALAEGNGGTVRELMRGLTSDQEQSAHELPPGVQRYFESNHGLPSWADAERIVRGQKLFTRYGWVMATGFFCSSLPQAYCAANGARVLTQTQGMTRNVRPRILETAQFVFDVCAEGSLGPAGKGARSAQKVRVLHAVIRHLIVAKGEWDSERLGVPINQQDLAGTLMTFSVVLLDALKTAGIEVSPVDEDAFLHLWKVVGRFLGVAPAVTPLDVADARAMMQVIRDDQWSSSVQGKLLAAELLASMREYLPGKLLDDLPAVLIRFFAPAPAPKLLGIADSTSLDLVLDAGVRLGSMLGVAAREEGRRNLVRRLSRDLMVGIVGAQRLARQSTFRIPSSLVRAWNLTPPG